MNVYEYIPLTHIFQIKNHPPIPMLRSCPSNLIGMRESREQLAE